MIDERETGRQQARLSFGVANSNDNLQAITERNFVLTFVDLALTPFRSGTFRESNGVAEWQKEVPCREFPLLSRGNFLESHSHVSFEQKIRLD